MMATEVSLCRFIKAWRRAFEIDRWGHCRMSLCSNLHLKSFRTRAAIFQYRYLGKSFTMIDEDIDENPNQKPKSNHSFLSSN